MPKDAEDRHTLSHQIGILWNIHGFTADIATRKYGCSSASIASITGTGL
jgi:hypothetical protein